jgi:2,4-dienoyl-CoA reductase-like NADH-dependent reductase (Old Yellow Enzyme family)/thioredoxin reductase
MVTEFKYLFTPIKVGPMTLRNRIVNSPHGTGFEKNDPYDERYVYYLVERAKGGAAMLCTGITEVDPRYVSVALRGLIANIDDSIIPWYRRISDAVHEYGAKFVAELSCRANLWPTRLYPEAAPPLAASAIPGDITKEARIEIDPEGVERMAKLFGSAAARVKAGGCDGIIILAGAGHLLGEFYSPLFNTRTDEFSGPMENRLRPLFMVIDEIRKNIGRDMALGVRISADEFMEGGATIDDAKAISILLDKSGQVDWIDVYYGNVGNWLSRGMQIPPMYISLGAYVPLAAAIREVVNIPVVHAGRINDPILAEKILADGHADLVGMARALIADPHLPNKAKAGQLEDIRQCVGAAEACISRVEAGEPMSCVQNAVVGREKEWAELKPASIKKKVMVIGGGPAGLEAARVATLRGHTVTLYEKTGELGGQVLIAAKAPTRQELSGITRWLALQVKKLGVDIHLNTEVTPELVAKEKPDAVVVATGSIPPHLSIPGATDRNLVDERSVLLDKASVGQRVVVLDGTGDTVGCSTAEFLAEQGKQVYILAKSYQVGEDIDQVTRPLVYRSLLEKGVILMPFTWIRSISDKEVITYNTFTFKEGKIEEIDTVVHAMPAVADNQIYKSLKGKVKELYAIGDCVVARRIETAIYDGSKVGREL